jgi:hypothetical protein
LFELHPHQRTLCLVWFQTRWAYLVLAAIPVANGSFLWTLGDLDGGGGGGTFLLLSLFGNGKAFFSGTSILISLFVDSLLPTGAGFVCSFFFFSFAGN